VSEPEAEPPDEQAVRFVGTGAEYFGIWIVNVCLIVLTLYLYAPWAKVRSERYFATHARFDGIGADYHAQPRQLVVGSLVALALMLFLVFGELLGPTMAVIAFAVSVLGLPLLSAWAAARSRRFRAGMTGWRNVRFGFDGTPERFLHYRVIVPVWMSLGIFASLGLADRIAGDDPRLFYGVIGVAGLIAIALLPRYRARFAQYTASHYRFGDERFTARLSIARVYLIHVRALFSGALVVLGAIAIALAVDALLGGRATQAVIDLFGALVRGRALDVGAMLTVLFLISLFLALAAIPGSIVREALMRVHVFESTRSPSLSLRSSLTPRALLWLRASNLLLVLFTLGLGWPWARVRSARLMLQTTSIRSKRPFDRLVETGRRAGAGLGDEVGDVLETDIGFGF